MWGCEGVKGSKEGVVEVGERSLVGIGLVQDVGDGLLDWLFNYVSFPYHASCGNRGDLDVSYWSGCHRRPCRGSRC
jgi:hypothetical protein